MTLDNLDLPYKVLTDKDPSKDEHITPEIASILDSVESKMVSGQPVIEQLEKMCDKYPQVIYFKDMLTMAHYYNDDIDKMKSAAQWTYESHPEFLQGRWKLAQIANIEGNLEQVLEYLGKDLKLEALYPDQKQFYASDVMAYHIAVFEYFWHSDQKDEAFERFKLLKVLDANHHTSLAATQIIAAHFSENQADIPEHLKDFLPRQDNESNYKTLIPSGFHFPEQMSWLYENGMEIAPEKLEQILSLERHKLIEDLKLVLHNSIIRFDEFNTSFKELGQENFLESVNHALHLLADLKSEEALNDVLVAVSQGEDYLHFWVQDSLYESVYAAVYHCGKNQTHVLFDYLKSQKVPVYSKSLIGETLARIVEDSEQDRGSYIKAYSEVLDVFIENPENENLLDIEATSNVIWDVCNLGYHELLPKISQLYKMGRVARGICGTYKEVETDIREDLGAFPMPFLEQNIYERYQDYLLEEQQEDSIGFTDNTPYWDNPQEPVQVAKKIGRNEPCPCGSGKKYKKCCLNG